MYDIFENAPVVLQDRALRRFDGGLNMYYNCGNAPRCATNGVLRRLSQADELGLENGAANVMPAA